MRFILTVVATSLFLVSQVHAFEATLLKAVSGSMNDDHVSEVLADATTDGKFVFFGCTPYSFSRATKTNVCAHTNGKFDVYDVELKKMITVNLPVKRQPKDIEELTAVYDVNGHTLFLATIPNIESGNMAGADEQILAIDLARGFTMVVQSLPKGSYCSQIRALPSGILCSLVQQDVNELVSTKLILFEYFSGRRTFEHSLGENVAMSGLSTRDMKTPNFVAYEDLGGGLHTAKRSYFFDPLDTKVYDLPNFDVTKGSAQTFVRGQFEFAGETYFVYESSRFVYDSDSSMSRFFNKAILINRKGGALEFDLPTLPNPSVPSRPHYTLLGGIAALGSDPILLLSSQERSLNPADRDVTAWNPVTGKQDLVANFANSTSLDWLPKAGLLVSMNCVSGSMPRVCSLVTLNPLTKSSQSLAMAPHEGVSIVQVHREFETILLGDDRNLYFYNPLKNQMALVFDRQVLAHIGAADATRQVSKDKALTWVETYDGSGKPQLEVYLVKLSN